MLPHDHNNLWYIILFMDRYGDIHMWSKMFVSTAHVKTSSTVGGWYEIRGFEVANMNALWYICPLHLLLFAAIIGVCWWNSYKKLQNNVFVSFIMFRRWLWFSDLDLDLHSKPFSAMSWGCTYKHPPLCTTTPCRDRQALYFLHISQLVFLFSFLSVLENFCNENIRNSKWITYRS